MAYTLQVAEIEKIVHLTRNYGDPALLLFFETVITDSNINFGTRVECVEYFLRLSQYRCENAVYILRKVAAAYETDINLLPIIIRTIAMIDPEVKNIYELLNIIPSDRRESIRKKVLFE